MVDGGVEPKEKRYVVQETCMLFFIYLLTLLVCVISTIAGFGDKND